MTNFKALWDKVLPADALPDLVASVSQDSINNFLEAHRKFDKDLYRRVETFEDAPNKKEFFRVDLIVGGDRSSHNANKALPLKISLAETTEQVSKLAAGFDVEYNYRFYGQSVNKRSSPTEDPSEPNAVIEANDVNFYFAWPSPTSGTPWTHHVQGIDFRLEAHLQIKQDEIDGQLQNSLEIIPVRLRVKKSAAQLLLNALPKIIGIQRADKSADDKITDLFFAIISYAASAIGPGLAESISLPILKIQNFEAYPMLFAIRDNAVTLGAALSPYKSAQDLQKRIASITYNFWDAVDKDIAEGGGLANLVLTKPSAAKVRQLVASQKAIRSSDIKLVSKQSILTNFRNVNLYAKGVLEKNAGVVSRSRQLPVRQSKSKQKVLTVADGLGTGINEFFLDRIVAQYGNTVEEDYTRELKLVVVRGRLGYKVIIGLPDISIDHAKGVTGSVPVDAFVGLLYRIKQINKCEVKWSSEKRRGIGVKGTPKLSIKTVSSSGLSIKADFNLSGVKLYTGAGFPIDDIVEALSPLFVKVLELILDTLAVLLSFVVVPVSFEFEGQNTKVALSKFKTDQYSKSGIPASSKNNYLLISASTEGKKR